ncbi:hypothetical protein AB205_0014860, partial [Aquarana catesbeiana]
MFVSVILNICLYLLQIAAMRHAPVQRHLHPFSSHLVPPGKHSKLFPLKEDNGWEEEEEEEPQFRKACRQPPRQRRGRRVRLRVLRSLYLRLYNRTVALPFYWKLWGVGGRRRRAGSRRREGGGGSVGVELGKAQHRFAREEESLANHIAEAEETGPTHGIPNGFSPLPAEPENILITSVYSINNEDGLAPNGPHQQEDFTPPLEKEVPALTEEHVACVQNLPCRRTVVQHVIQSYQRLPGNTLLRSFRVTYKRHVLTMDDLSTLYGQNWLNDQVMNMYGDLVMDAVPEKVDIFSKQFLLIPIHLEVHWSLVCVDVSKRTITYFDSQRTLNRRCPK